MTEQNGLKCRGALGFCPQCKKQTFHTYVKDEYELFYLECSICGEKLPMPLKMLELLESIGFWTEA